MATVNDEQRLESFRALLKQVATKLSGKLEEIGGPGSASFDAQLPGGRHQRVFLMLDEDTIRYSTQCASWLSDFQNPNVFKTLLKKNYQLKHGFFALNPEGGLELVDTQLLETADPEELYVSIVNLATVGDFCERELAKDRSKDVF
ncbi:hypothetical protein HY251_12995 [bacterium]|nr:hypothetical protein [bacterium]